MEVNVIFADKVKVDDRNNFRIDFQNEDRILELLLNRKKDYYVTNAIAFMKNAVLASNKKTRGYSKKIFRC